MNHHIDVIKQLVLIVSIGFGFGAVMGGCASAPASGGGGGGSEAAVSSAGDEPGADASDSGDGSEEAGASVPSDADGDAGVEAGALPPSLDGSGTSSSDDLADFGSESGAGDDIITTPDADDEEIQSGTLTAGAFDDNLNFDVFASFVADQLRSAFGGSLASLSLGQRVIFHVQDEAGDSLAGARVVVTASGGTLQQSQTVLDMTTRADGRAVLLTGIDGGASAADLNVTVTDGAGFELASTVVSATAGTKDIVVEGAVSALPAALDLAFVIDATGSMADELAYIQAEVRSIANAVADLYPDVDRRYALIVYRDEGDLYVTRTFDFTDSLTQFESDLGAQRADGGFDYPEALDLALREAGDLSWRSGDTARVLFLVADAPPHAEYAASTLEAVHSLRGLGVGIYPVAASGTGDEAELIMRLAAQLTFGQYLFLTDDSGVGNPHAEPHIPCYEVQRLDQTLIRMISTELSGQRVEADDSQILRRTGHSVNGVCVADGQG